MLAEQRMEEIMRRLKERRTLTVDGVADEFGVSVDTVRRDFNRLASRSRAQRTHGGIILPEDRDTTLAEREKRNYREKSAIARAAANLVEDNETIVVDAGSTMALLIDEITAREVTVVTYSVEIACRAIRRENLTVFMAGGLIRPTTGGAVGEDTIRMIRGVRASRGFIAANAIDKDHELMTPNYHEAGVKQSIIDVCSINILLLDSSKFDRRSLVRFASIDEIDVLITDDGISAEYREELADHVSELRIVSTNRDESP